MITLRFGIDDAVRCRFATSPLWETMAAVRTLTDRRHQRFHAPWLRWARSRADRLDLSLISAVQPSRGYVPDFVTPPPERRLEAIERELERVRATPLERVLEELGRSFGDRPADERVPDAEAILADPAATLRRLVGELEDVWRILVAPQWPAIRRLLDDDVRYHSRLLATAGMEQLFAQLHPRLRWKQGCLSIDQRSTDDRDLAGAGLVLMPSAFVWPTPAVIVDPPWQPTIAYPARGVDGLWQEALSAPPGALARILGRSRATLLVDVERPASTTALARGHGLSAGTVSEHLTALRDAGLVEASREGHEVLYRRTPLGDSLVEGRAHR